MTNDKFVIMRSNSKQHYSQKAKVKKIINFENYGKTEIFISCSKNVFALRRSFAKYTQRLSLKIKKFQNLCIEGVYYFSSCAVNYAFFSSKLGREQFKLNVMV
jgi:hypothetical protein